MTKRNHLQPNHSSSSPSLRRGLGYWGGALLLAVPALLGAKGCELVNLGSDEVPCAMGDACDADQFCLFEAGASCGKAGAMGLCSALPETCSDEVSPVCGCDGRTYDNACRANASGVSVAKTGACEKEDPPPTGECGGIAGKSCDEGEFCNYPLSALCGAADQMGTCEALPEACDLSYVPVCGCDDKTYGNECAAHIAGVSVQKEGECASPDDPPTKTRCDTSEDCASGEICSRPDAQTCEDFEVPGVCEKGGDLACITLYDPVCGCDGKTYGNSCSAGVMGVLVDYEGECGAEKPDACGGLLGLSCSDDEFCNYPPDAICGAADATGVCEPLPEACTAIFDPVCGCDGQTYGSACAANLMGVSVASEGECEGDPGSRVCGGLTGAPCEEGFFCSFDEDALCGAADATGICESIPEVCDTGIDPVCGCDDKTYQNECAANAAGVSVAHTGECEQPEWDCGGIAGATCEAGEFCNFENHTGCVPDGTGLCEPIPEACLAVVDPVCGCDGKTYNSGCDAHSAGVSVQSQGACE